MARQPVSENPLLPAGIDEPNRVHLTDLGNQLRAVFLEYGSAINDDLLTRLDWTRAIAFDDSPYAVLDTDRFLIVDTTAGAVVLTLPPAAEAEPHLFGVKKIAAANTVTVNGRSGELMDGAGSQVLTAQYELLLMLSDKTTWHLLHLGAP